MHFAVNTSGDYWQPLMPRTEMGDDLALYRKPATD